MSTPQAIPAPPTSQPDDAALVAAITASVERFINQFTDDQLLASQRATWLWRGQRAVRATLRREAPELIANVPSRRLSKLIEPPLSKAVGLAQFWASERRLPPEERLDPNDRIDFASLNWREVDGIWMADLRELAQETTAADEQ